MGINCAIDGPSGAGKSTVAKTVANRLGFLYVDTGALYRTIGLFVYRQGKDTTLASDVVPCLPDIELELKHQNGQQVVVLNGEIITSQIRTPEIAMAASNVSAIPEVREYLLDLQRDIARKNNIIMDGRDIGTVILPNAEVKVFLTASAEERARRRHAEMVAKGIDEPFEVILQKINERDYNDSHRAAAPLKQAEDAVLVDSSDMNVDEVVETICRLIEEKMPKNPEKPAKKGFSKPRLFFYGILRHFVLFFFKIAFKIKYEGVENIPTSGCYIVAPNHRTWFDPIIINARINSISAYIAKDSLFKHKLFIPIFKLLHIFPVKRGSSDRSALQKAINYLNNGYNLTVFPEGTRSKDGTLGKAKSGIVFIRHYANADILPVGISCPQKLKFRSTITVRFGKLLPSEIFEAKALTSSETRRLRDIIMTKIGELIDA